jgi:hypothetical protein
MLVKDFVTVSWLPSGWVTVYSAQCCSYTELQNDQFQRSKYELSDIGAISVTGRSLQIRRQCKAGKYLNVLTHWKLFSCNCSNGGFVEVEVTKQLPPLKDRKHCACKLSSLRGSVGVWNISNVIIFILETFQITWKFSSLIVADRRVIMNEQYCAERCLTSVVELGWVWSVAGCSTVSVPTSSRTDQYLLFTYIHTYIKPVPASLLSCN